MAPPGGGIGGLYTKFLHMEYNRDLAAKNPLLGGVSVRWSCWKGGLKIIYRFWDVCPGKTMLNKTMLDSTIRLGNVSIE